MLARLKLDGSILAVGHKSKLLVEIHNLEATDLCSYTYSAKEIQEGFQCEVRVYCLNNLSVCERRRLKRDSAKWKNKSRCLGHKVTADRIFVILLPVCSSQAHELRQKPSRQPSPFFEAVPDVDDLSVLLPLVEGFTVSDSWESFSSDALIASEGTDERTGEGTVVEEAVDERAIVEGMGIKGAVIEGAIAEGSTPKAARKGDSNQIGGECLHPESGKPITSPTDL